MPVLYSLRRMALIALLTWSSAFAQQFQPAGGNLTGIIPEVLFQDGSSQTWWLGTRNMGLYKSVDNGQSWANQKNAGFSGISCYGFVKTSNNTLLAGSYQGIFKSTDQGATWLLLTSWPTTREVNALAAGNNGFVVAATTDGLFTSNDHGNSWQTTTVTTYSYDVTIQAGTTKLAAATETGLYTSQDLGVTWKQATGTSLFNVTDVGISPSGIVLANAGGLLLRSANYGSTVQQLSSGPIDARDFAFSGNTLFLSAQNGIYRSTDQGQTWSNVSTNLKDDISLVLRINSEGILYAGGFTSGIWRSADSGVNWTLWSQSGLTAPHSGNFFRMTNGTLLAATYSGLFASQDDGQTFSPFGTTLPSNSIQSVAAFGNTIVVSSSYRGLFRSSDGGQTWMQPTSGFQESSAYDLAVDETGNFYASGTLGVYRSTNGGQTWSLDLVDGGQATAFYLGTKGLYASTVNGIYRTNNQGSSWTRLHQGTFLYSAGADFLEAPNGDLYLPTRNGVYKSTDDGQTWTALSQPGLSSQVVYTILALPNGTLYAGTRIGRFLSSVYQSTNGGTSWTAIPGITSTNVLKLWLTQNQYLLAASSTGLFRTDQRVVANERDTLPEGFALEQNYPNPFNPATQITFTLPETTPVSLRVLDVLGREVAQLASGIWHAGTHRLVFQADGLPSGAYWYQLQTPRGTAIKHMILIR